MNSKKLQFDQLVRTIFIRNVGEIVALGKPNELPERCFVVKAGTESVLIATKYYLDKRVPRSLIEIAIHKLSQDARGRGFKIALLVVSCEVDYFARDNIADFYGVTVIDRLDLKRLAGDDRLLQRELGDLLDDGIDFFECVPVVAPIDDNGQTPAINEELPFNLQALTQAPAIDETGSKLRDELLSIKPGKSRESRRGAKSEWQKFENWSKKAIQYLFGPDLYNLVEQQTTEDGMNRFDLVSRVKPFACFWRFVVEQLRSQYVIFECKNYSEKITQKEIASTERYLFPKAFRTVAIVISRNGANQSALTATAGAMRENGKLVLVLSDKEILELLSCRGNGEEPSDLLFEKADQLLLRLAR